MSRTPRRLSEGERAVWETFAGRIRPLRGGPAAAEPPVMQPLQTVGPDGVPPTPAPVRQAHFLASRPGGSAPPVPIGIGDPSGGIDRATWQRLRSGRLEPARRLDLHGHTAQRACAALVGFLRAAHADGVRCVEVVTGRGSGAEGGVIRREFPFWLNRPDIRPLVLGAAHPHAANPGAVRLLLRRARSRSRYGPHPKGG